MRELKRRVFDRNTNIQYSVNEWSFTDLEDQIRFTLIPYIYTIVDYTTIETINTTLRVLAREMELMDHPIIDPSNGQFIWGFLPVSFDVKANTMNVEYKYNRCI